MKRPLNCYKSSLEVFSYGNIFPVEIFFLWKYFSYGLEDLLAKKSFRHYNSFYSMGLSFRVRIVKNEIVSGVNTIWEVED